MCNEIAVSVMCNAYNHELYIEDALKGFVMQKTNFLFEVLVHDDASTDRTADIIREYEKKYPDLIKPIYQTENQYSKNSTIIGDLQRSRAKGKYFAICEGDDYWTDPYKLQKQFDAMEAHPEIDICAHAATKTMGNKRAVMVAPSSKDCIFTLPEVIEGGGGFVVTNSLFYRGCLSQSKPEFRTFLSLDYTMQIHGSIRGGMLYLKDNMSVYRGVVANSWTDKMRGNENAFRKHNDKVIEMLNIFNKEFDGAYTDVVQRTALNLRFNELYKACDITNIRKEPYKELYRKLILKRKVKLIILGLIKKYLCKR